MKIQYHRYTELGCFTIRGKVGANEWKMLHIGFDSLFKELEETLVINILHGEISPDILPLITEYKKTIPKLTTHKVFFITKEKPLGDFPKIELMISRLPGSKGRQIGDLINLEDQVYILEHEIAAIEAQIQQLGFDENSSRKEIQKNNMMKAAKNSLEGCIKWQKHRKENMKAAPSEVEELHLKLKAAFDDLEKALGKQVDL